jgi:hypothetical protein
MSQQENPPPPAEPEDTALKAAEYTTLRDQVLKRVELHYQIINLILIVAGTFLTIGVQANIPASVLLTYPILALFLTANWAYNGVVMLQITSYLREHYETKATGLAWETYLREQTPSRPSSMLSIVSTAGLVLTTQLLAVGLGLLKATFEVTEIVLLICSAVAIILTLLLLRTSLIRRR